MLDVSQTVGRESGCPAASVAPPDDSTRTLLSTAHRSHSRGGGHPAGGKIHPLTPCGTLPLTVAVPRAEPHPLRGHPATVPRAALRARGILIRMPGVMRMLGPPSGTMLTQCDCRDIVPLVWGGPIKVKEMMAPAGSPDPGGITSRGTR